jgi:hypothetical protein
VADVDEAFSTVSHFLLTVHDFAAAMIGDVPLLPL